MTLLEWSGFCKGVLAVLAAWVVSLWACGCQTTSSVQSPQHGSWVCGEQRVVDVEVVEAEGCTALQGVVTIPDVVGDVTVIPATAGCSIQSQVFSGAGTRDPMIRWSALCPTPHADRFTLFSLALSPTRSSYICPLLEVAAGANGEPCRGMPVPIYTECGAPSDP